MKFAACATERLSNSLGKSTVRSAAVVVAGLFLLQPFLDLRSWGHKNRGILEMLVLASL